MTITDCVAQSGSTKTSQLNKLIFTFSTPFKEGKTLYKEIQTIASYILAQKIGTASIKDELESAGAHWIITSNISATQIGFIYPGQPQKLIGLTKSFINKFSNALETIEITPENLSIEEIIFYNNLDKTYKNEISIFSEGPISVYRGELASLTQNLNSKLNFEQTIAKQKQITNTQPSLVHTFIWNKFSPSVFLSAKYIGENYLQQFSKTSGISYKIWNQPGKTILGLFLTNTENQLFSNYYSIKSFVNSSVKDSSLQNWANFCKKAQAIFEQDLRDLIKSSFHKAWQTHWNKSLNPKETLNFIAPESIEEKFFAPQKFRRNFSFSTNSLPKFIAFKKNQKDPIADISICIEGSTQQLKKLQGVISRTTLDFPVTFSKLSLNKACIEFFAPNNKIYNFSTIIQALLIQVITPQHPEKLNAKIKLSIAGVSSLPPFVLRGLLESGWSKQSTIQNWQLASKKDLEQLLQIKAPTPEALAGKWNVIISTPKGKAKLLSLLADSNLLIHSFDLF